MNADSPQLDLWDRGYARVPNSAIDSMAKVGANLMGVLLAIARHADRNGRAYPSVDRLAAITGLSPRAVQRQLGQLVESGILIRNPRGGRSTAYQFSGVPLESPPAKGTTVASPPRNGATQMARGGVTSVTQNKNYLTRLTQPARARRLPPAPSPNR